MSDGQLHLNADGSFSLCDDGTFAINPYCCNECEFCDKTAPSSPELSLIFSGIAYCTSCLPSYGTRDNGVKYTTFPSTINGTHILTRNTSCHYNVVKLVTDLGELDAWYNDTTCTGEITGTITHDKLEIVADAVAGNKWRVYARTYMSHLSNVGGMLFWGESAADEACWDSVFSNDSVNDGACGTSSPYPFPERHYYAFGGTVTIEN